MTYLQEVSKGNTLFMVEMIRIFLTRTPETLLLIKTAIDQQVWEQVGFYAHKLKATYAYMGLDDLKEILIEIEKDAKNLCNLETIAQKFRLLNEQTTPILLEISEYCSQLEKEI